MAIDQDGSGEISPLELRTFSLFFLDWCRVRLNESIESALMNDGGKQSMLLFPRMCPRSHWIPGSRPQVLNKHREVSDDGLRMSLSFPGVSSICNM